METLEYFQQSSDPHFAKVMSEINHLRAAFNLKDNRSKDGWPEEDGRSENILRCCRDRNRGLKQKDEQDILKLAQLEKENVDIQAEVFVAKARAIKLENYTRQENV